MMKKFISILLITTLVLTFIIPCCVKAYSFNLDVSIKSPSNSVISEGDTVELQFKLMNIDMGELGMNTLEAYLEYDKNVFEHLTDDDVEGRGNWSIEINKEEGNESEGHMLLSTMAGGVTTDKVIGVVTFTVKSNLSDSVKANAKPFKIRGIQGCVGNELIDETDKSISYTFEGGSTPTEETVTVTPTSASINVNETVQLRAESSKNATITWTSSNTSVATVNSSGLVVGKSAGTAVITATGESKSATCTVTVLPKVDPGVSDETINMVKTTASVKVGETIGLAATSSKGATITWTSSNSSIATVSSTGVVTGVSVGTTTITARGESATATCQVTVYPKDSDDPDDPNNPDDPNLPEGDWTDFSSAKYELKKFGTSQASIEISGVTPKEDHNYYYMVSNNSNMPTASATELSANYWKLEYNSEKGIFVCKDYNEIAKFVELNQDVYISILEQTENSEEKYVTYGNKLTKYSEPKYSDGFFATFMSNKATQIVTTFTHNSNANRNIEIKVGKITDYSILKKIKNQDSSGFADLLKYAKSNSGIYDQTTSASQDVYTISYNTADGKSVIDLSKIDDGSYYFLYVKADDENGKYINQEAVTFALSKAYPTLTEGSWSLMFYGAEDFKWADFVDAAEDGKDGGKDDGKKEADKEIPQTGTNEMILVAIFGGLTISAVGAFIGYRKNRI
ncbi:MAG: Ig-like domain-containing protein [Clostridia bacterium]|nr:Ig-like domain-containing protein [Clostridia bacterium]